MSLRIPCSLQHFFRDEAASSEASKWLEEYNPQEDSELARTANELLGTVDDPKFSNTEVGWLVERGREGI